MHGIAREHIGVPLNISIVNAHQTERELNNFTQLSHVVIVQQNEIETMGRATSVSLCPRTSN